MKLAEQHLQDKDQDALTIVLGARGTAGKPGFPTAKVGCRTRAYAGLLVVGNDVMSLTSTFLSSRKVELHRCWQPPSPCHLQACHISPCSTMILTASGRELHLWDAASGMLKKKIKVHVNGEVFSEIFSCRFFPGGKTVVSASGDRGSFEKPSRLTECVKFWDIATGRLLRTLVGHTRRIACVDVSSDNTRVLSASHDETWKVWNSRTGELEHTQHTSGANYCSSFSPNGRLLLVACDRKLVLYDSTSYQLQHAFTGHGDCVLTCSFAPDGTTVLKRLR